MWQPPDPETFNRIVWKIAKQIPPGRVMTYGQIAAMIPPPDGVEPPDYERMGPRWVGTAMNNTPSDRGIPWQRVMNSKGGISLPAGSREALIQRERLEAEGVEFNDRGLIDFDTYGWDGPAADWLETHGLYPPPSMKKPPGSATQMSLL
jgi:methylated-DNA-protein-cysteine methyltransferase related protein